MGCGCFGRLINILVHLNNQLIDTFESKLGANSLDKVDGDLNTIDVRFKIDDKGFYGTPGGVECRA